MSWAVRLMPLYTFTVWTGTTLLSLPFMEGFYYDTEEEKWVSWWSCLACDTVLLNNFCIHEFVVLNCWLHWLSEYTSLRLCSITGVLKPVCDGWQALLYRRLWIPVPRNNRTWDGGLGEQNLIPCQAASQPAVAQLWWDSKGEVSLYRQAVRSKICM